MNTKKCFLGGLASFAVLVVLSGLWYMVLMAGFYKENFAAVNRERMEPIHWVAGTLGVALLAFLMSTIYPIGYKGGSPAKEGLRFGILVGLLVWVSSNLVLFGAYKIPLNGTIIDSLYHLFEEGMAGLTIALVYGRGSAQKLPAPSDGMVSIPQGRRP